MKRDALNSLREWTKSKSRKPLIVRGARQVGKTWLVQKLGEDFESFVEINFEKNPEVKNFFEQNIDPKELIKNIANYYNQSITDGKTLLFFDEIQMCPAAITSLRYFYEEMPELHVISAGSLLEFELHKISFPVGRVSFMYVYPLSFAEYLTATGKDHLRTMLMENGCRPVLEPFHQQCLKEVSHYVVIGGMPEVIKTFIETGSFHECQNLQSDLLETYISDFKKYAKKSQIKYLEKVFKSIPLELGNKFKYSAVSRDIKSTVLGEALDLLEMAGIVSKVYHSSANGVPLGAESNLSKFKVLFFDVGLAQRMLGFDYRGLLLDPDISQINNGAVAELFVGCELISQCSHRNKAHLYYWHREARSSNAEVDYVIEKNGKIVPVEVKSGKSGRMKSLKMFMESKGAGVGLKISTFPFSQNKSIQTVPFYGLEAAFVEG